MRTLTYEEETAALRQAVALIRQQRDCARDLNRIMLRQLARAERERNDALMIVAELKQNIREGISAD